MNQPSNPPDRGFRRDSPRQHRRDGRPRRHDHRPVGSGKSDLALRLLDRGFMLVSDDQTIVSRDGDRLIAVGAADHRRQARDPRHRHRRHGACRERPVALIVELTSDIQRLPDDSRERPILGIEPAVGQIDAMTASAAVQGRAGARPHGPRVLMTASGGCRACLLVTGMSGRGQIDRARRARGYGLGRGRQSARRPARRVRSRRGRMPDSRRPQSAWTPAAAALTPAACRNSSARSKGVDPEILYLDCSGAS